MGAPQKDRLFRRCSAFVLLLLLTLGMQGCVWLRLLEVKNQLTEFDQHFRVDTQQGFQLRFLEPVLYGSDLTGLARMDPTHKSNHPAGQEWEFYFAKEPILDDPQPQDLQLYCTINPAEKVQALRLAPIFLQLAPARFLEHSIRSLASANVDARKRHLHADTKTLAQAELKPPTYDHLLSKLGTPHFDKFQGEKWIVSYYYRLQSNTAIQEEKTQAEVHLFFDQETRRLNRFRAQFARLKLSVNYREIADAYEEIAS